MKKLLSCALLLAGGQSSRMGEDKALLLIDKKPLLYRLMKDLLVVADHVMIAAGEPSRERLYRESLAELGERGAVSFVFDGEFYGSGPLAGLAAGLSAAPEGYVFVMACDMPVVSQTYIEQLVRAAYTGGEPDVLHAPKQPFHALYHTRTSASIREALRSEDYRVMKVLGDLQTIELEPINRGSENFLNLNTPEDYEQYIVQKGGTPRDAE